jgi:hypothetical protein
MKPAMHKTRHASDISRAVVRTSARGASAGSLANDLETENSASPYLDGHDLVSGLGAVMDPRAEMVLISVALLLAAYLTGVAVEVLT